MAEETQTKDTKTKETEGLEKQTSNKGSLIGWLILFSVVVAGATGGFALSQLIGGTDPASPVDPKEAGKEEQNPDAFLAAEEGGHASWTYDQIEPVVANLDEPGVSRFIRATVTLELSGDVDQVKMEPFLLEKNLVMKDWLTTYFAGLSLEDVRGSRNLSRIKQEIQDQLNEILFPDSKPYINRVLFKEFAVQ